MAAGVIDAPALARAAAWLRAIGIEDPARVQDLCREIERAATARESTGVSPAQRAVEEAVRLLDDWLTAELDLAGEDEALAARAALLGLPPSVRAGQTLAEASADLLQAIRDALLPAAPDPAPLPMPAQAIELPRLVARPARAIP